MDDLVTWLGAQLDEDERIARAADGPEWEPGDGNISEGGLYATDIGCVLAWFELGLSNSPGPGHLPAFGSLDRHAHENSVHAARWDPARVLAEVEAKRAILREHVCVVLHGGEGARHFDTKRVCRSCEPLKQFPELSWPCPTLLALALPYRDRPGWKPEWAPEATP